MQNGRFGMNMIAAFMCAALAAPPALADRPDHAGGGKGRGKQEQHEKALGERRGDPLEREQRYERSGDRPRNSSRAGDDRRRGSSGPSITVHFGERHRSVVHDYYRQHYSGSKCPPGLAKKNNGCMPPGQAKKWSRGRPLPRDVVFYDLPPALVIELGAPPPNHRYVRVAADILLITIGTGIVIDAVEDLSRM